MTLKWRQKKQGWSRSSASILMPVQVTIRMQLRSKVAQNMIAYWAGDLRATIAGFLCGFSGMQAMSSGLIY